ncbi:MAG TPA: hypothetical protein VK963_04415 [Candidatus Saccharimonadales bacterium]|nr:hypothetical protein [Candidatus Saccharimonadales bacterium]
MADNGKRLYSVRRPCTHTTTKAITSNGEEVCTFCQEVVGRVAPPVIAARS